MTLLTLPLSKSPTARSQGRPVEDPIKARTSGKKRSETGRRMRNRVQRQRGEKAKLDGNVQRLIVTHLQLCVMKPKGKGVMGRGRPRKMKLEQ